MSLGVGYHRNSMLLLAPLETTSDRTSLGRARFARAFACRGDRFLFLPLWRGPRTALNARGSFSLRRCCRLCAMFGTWSTLVSCPFGVQKVKDRSETKLDSKQQRGIKRKSGTILPWTSQSGAHNTSIPHNTDSAFLTMRLGLITRSPALLQVCWSSRIFLRRWARQRPLFWVYAAVEALGSHSLAFAMPRWNGKSWPQRLPLPWPDEAPSASQREPPCSFFNVSPPVGDYEPSLPRSCQSCHVRVKDVACLECLASPSGGRALCSFGTCVTCTNIWKWSERSRNTWRVTLSFYSHCSWGDKNHVRPQDEETDDEESHLTLPHKPTHQATDHHPHPPHSHVSQLLFACFWIRSGPCAVGDCHSRCQSS